MMAAPGPLAALPADKLSEAQAMTAWLDDMAAYQVLREQTSKLQAFIITSCQ